MRIDRVRLKNFCGVGEAEVKFAATGVTIVHGPNEAGKSTLMTAINVLFDHRDDSRKEEVRLTKPVNRDVGSEVEADVEIGDCRFTYFKRFHKDRETVLTVHAPAAESLVGREAHERVQQILKGSVDTALWQALRIVQGSNLEMPALHNQPALAQALDRAAGQAKSGEKEEALFDAARSEFSLYYTDTGREKEDPVGQARTRAGEAAEQERGFLAQLNEVEDDVGRYATLERSVATLMRNVAGLETAQHRARVAWDAVSKLAEQIERAKSAHQLADQAMQAAKSAVQQRNEMIGRVAADIRKVDEARAQNSKTADALERAATALTAAKIARDAARVTANRCDAQAETRREDHEFRDAEFELLRMEERLEHVARADVAAAAASALRDAARITEKLRAGIRSAEVVMKTAQGVLNSASPKFIIRALKATSLTINGGQQNFTVGEERLMSVTEPVSATIADLVEVRVEPGTSAETLQHEFSEAQSALAKACAKAGVAGPEEAEGAWTALQDARRTLADRDRIASEHLRDLSREALGKYIREAKARVQAYRANRNSDLAIPATSEEAKTLREQAANAAAEARKDLKKAEAVLAQVQEHHAGYRADHAASAALLEQARKDHLLAQERLETERTRRSDDGLNSALVAAEALTKSARASLDATQVGYGNTDPASAKAILDTSVSALKSARDQCDAQDRDLIVLRTRLDLIGDKGLAEALAGAQRVTFEASDSIDRLLRRATATRLLCDTATKLRRDTLRAEREAVRSAYVAPQHRLYFLPDPQGQAWLRPILGATEIGRFKLRSPTVFMIGYRRAKRAR